MKLSMWMLVKWFEDYSPTAIILDGKQAIEGVRFYTDNTPPDNRFLYVCRMGDIYPGETSDSVLLVFQNDTLSLSSDDPNEVFNRVIEAFEFYNDWERRLLSARSSMTPEQDIIDACSDLLGPMFIMDGSMNIVASSKGYALGEINDFWDIVILGKGLPDISRTVGSSFSRLHFVDHNCMLFVDESAAPYSYGISASIHDSKGEVVGQMVIASRSSMGSYEMQLADMIAKAVDSVKSRRIPTNASGYSESILTDILEGRISSEEGSRKLALIQEWHDDVLLCAIRVELERANASEFASLKRLLMLNFPDSVIVIRNNGVEGVVRLFGKAALQDTFCQLDQKGAYRFGLSNEFRDASHIAIGIRQAADALRYSPPDQRLCLFKTQALNVLTHSSDRAYAVSAAHSALALLREWEEAHHVHLTETLRCFLECERSYAKTAKTLHVHRNTVLYRIEKACELADLDLEDAYERLYLTVSFLVCDYGSPTTLTEKHEP